VRLSLGAAAEVDVSPVLVFLRLLTVLSDDPSSFLRGEPKDVETADADDETLPMPAPTLPMTGVSMCTDDAIIGIFVFGEDEVAADRRVDTTMAAVVVVVDAADVADRARNRTVRRGEI
jgi:hypothetical protein